MYNSHVTKFPHQVEPGQYLALDIGGTNLRIVYYSVIQNGDKKTDNQVLTQNFDVGSEYRQSNGKKVSLFPINSVS